MIFVRSGMFVYIMRATRFPGVFKIGISNDPKFRSWWISKTISGDAVVLFKMELFFAYPIEQSLHRMFKPFSAKMKGSGKTEWFRPGIPIWVWMVGVIITLWLYPGIVGDPNAIWYLSGFLFFAFVLPGILFVSFVGLLLFLIRVVQECAIAVMIFVVLKFAFDEVSTQRPRAKLIGEKNISKSVCHYKNNDDICNSNHLVFWDLSA